MPSGVFLAMRPLNTIELERLLLIMNALPRMGVGAILASLDEKSPDAKTPGALRLIFAQRTHGRGNFWYWHR